MNKKKQKQKPQKKKRRKKGKHDVGRMKLTFKKAQIIDGAMYLHNMNVVNWW